MFIPMQWFSEGSVYQTANETGEQLRRWIGVTNINDARHDQKDVRHGVENDHSGKRQTARAGARQPRRALDPRRGATRQVGHYHSNSLSMRIQIPMRTRRSTPNVTYPVHFAKR